MALNAMNGDATNGDATNGDAMNGDERLGSMEQTLQFLVTGLGLGGIYAMIGVGFVLIHNVTNVINFAQGEFAMIGAMIATTLVATGLPLPLAFVLATLAAAAVGVVVERAAIATSTGASSDVRIIITVGVAFLLQGLGLAIWGPDPRSLPSFTGGPPVRFLGTAMSRQTLWVLAMSVLVGLALWLFFNRSVVGKAMIASASDPEAARLQGINPSAMSLIAFALAAGLAGAAGVIITPLTAASTAMGVPLALKGFIAAVIGGLRSPLAAIFGGFTVGVAEALLGGYVSSALKSALTFLLLFGLLLAMSRSGRLRTVARV